MTIGEVEEFLWTLSTCLEGEIGNWQIRFAGVSVAVRIDTHGDRVAISAPTTFPWGSELRRWASSAGVRYHLDRTEVHAVLLTRLSKLTISDLQAGFQQVVDSAKEPPPSR
jgi:hypothetical protein